MQPGTTIKATRRDIADALEALVKLAKDRGFPDSATVSRVGKTIRRLREANETLLSGQDSLVNSYAKRGEDDKPVPGVEPGTFQMEDMRAYMIELHKLMREEDDVEVFPIPLAALGDNDRNGRNQVCSRCKQLTGLPTAEGYATLVDLGILVEKGADRSAADG